MKAIIRGIEVEGTPDEIHALEGFNNQKVQKFQTFDFGNGRGLADTAYVGPDAWIYGNARIYGNVKVYDNAVVYGNAKVCEDCVNK